MRRTVIDYRERVGAGVLAGAVVAGLGFALVAGLNVPVPVTVAQVATFLALIPPTPPKPPPPPPPHPKSARRQGASAPPNRRSVATPVVAPPPVVPTPPPRVVAAAKPATGVQATSGAAPVAGPGTGAGGLGDGTGDGQYGDGDGAGGTPAREIRRLRFADLSGDVRDVLLHQRIDYAVGVRFVVGVDGRLRSCGVTRSSGYPALDTATCRAAMAKLRFSPERDASGRAVPVTFSGVQEWPASRAWGPDDDD